MLRSLGLLGLLGRWGGLLRTPEGWRLSPH